MNKQVTKFYIFLADSVLLKIKPGRVVFFNKIEQYYQLLNNRPTANRKFLMNLKKPFRDFASND